MIPGRQSLDSFEASFSAKMSPTAAKIAAWLHVAHHEGMGDGVICGATMAHAVELARWFAQAGMAARLGAGPAITELVAERIAAAVDQLRDPETGLVTVERTAVRDLFSGRARPSSQQLASALGDLVAANFLRSEKRVPAGGRGRPATVYTASPRWIAPAS